MIRVGLFGGTFDPPHLGHLEVAKVALQSREVDTVWFLPCWRHAFDKKPTDFTLRVIMIVRMLQNEDDIWICTDEGQIMSSHSVEILKFIQEQNPDKKFRLILGTDNYWRMDEWKDKDEVIKIAPPLWVTRTGQSNIPEKSYHLYNTISSTQIRQLIYEGKSVNHLLHPKVNEFIVQNSLYKER